MRVGMTMNQRPEPRLIPRATIRENVTLDTVACALENQFEIMFGEFLRFTKDELSGKIGLGGEDRQGQDWPAGVTVTSEDPDKKEIIEAQMAVLAEIANKDTMADSDPARYRDALLAIYQEISCSPDGFADALVVGIQREGFWLAKDLGFAVDNESAYCPHAKRMHYEGGVVVGLEEHNKTPEGKARAVIVDGAIATGATIITIMVKLKSMGIKSITTISAHSTEFAVHRIAAFAEELAMECDIRIGHVSGRLNGHHYAVEDVRGEDRAEELLVVGDLGDTLEGVYMDQAGTDGSNRN